MSTDFTEHRKRQLEMGKKFKGLLKQKCPIYINAGVLWEFQALITEVLQMNNSV